MSDLCRAKTKDAKEVVGWYCQAEGRHFVVPENAEVAGNTTILWDVDAIEIDPATAAFETGKDDKNGKRIYGSKGEFQGGDRVRADGSVLTFQVNWDDRKLHWGIPMATALGDYESDELEIIPGD